MEGVTMYPAHYGPPQTAMRFGIASLVLGVLSLPLVVCSFILGVVPASLAVVFGHLSIYRANWSGSRSGKGMGIAGLVLGYIALGLIMVVSVGVFLQEG
jgi:hypothetical protein